MPDAKKPIEIACQQVLADDASVFSIQWVDLPFRFAGQLSSVEMLHRYLNYIRKFTLTMIRPLILETGIEFRVCRSTVSLINFLPLEQAENFAVLRVCGGLLVQPHQCERGELLFGAERLQDVVRLSLQLSDFCPLILGSQKPSWVRFWLYRLTQAAIHRLVTVRFLSLLCRELVGSAAGMRVVNVIVREGKPV